MLVKRKKRHFKLKLFLMVLITAAVSLFYYFDKTVDKKLEAIAEVTCESYAQSVISSAAEECMVKLDSEGFVKKTESNGKIISIEVNSTATNEYKSLLSNKISELLSKQKHQEYKISLGSILGSNLLSGVGPKITMSFQKEGSVNIDIKSEFTGSGINQTVHRVYVEVSVTLLSITPAGNFSFPYSTDFILSETIIVGDTPQFYAADND